MSDPKGTRVIVSGLRQRKYGRRLHLPVGDGDDRYKRNELRLGAGYEQSPGNQAGGETLPVSILPTDIKGSRKRDALCFLWFVKGRKESLRIFIMI